MHSIGSLRLFAGPTRMGTRNPSHFSYFPVERIQKNKFHAKENTGNIFAVYTNTSIICVVLYSVRGRSRAQFSISLFSLIKVFGCAFSALAARSGRMLFYHFCIVCAIHSSLLTQFHIEFRTNVLLPDAASARNKGGQEEESDSLDRIASISC